MKTEMKNKKEKESQILNADEVMALQMMQYPVKKILKTSLSEFDIMYDDIRQLQD